MAHATTVYRWHAVNSFSSHPIIKQSVYVAWRLGFDGTSGAPYSAV
jgi:hypothetical protein